MSRYVQSGGGIENVLCNCKVSIGERDIASVSHS